MPILLKMKIQILVFFVLSFILKDARAGCGSYSAISTASATTSITEGIVEKITSLDNNADIWVYFATAKQDGTPITCAYTNLWDAQVGGVSDYVKIVRQSAVLAMTLNYYFEPVLVMNSGGAAEFHLSLGSISVRKP